MAKRDKLLDEAVQEFLSANAGWSRIDEPSPALTKTFLFKDYASGVAFVVRLAFAAEKHDHHPDLHVHWGRVRVDWSTHDAGGITSLDIQMAAVTEQIYQATPAGG
ncbi:MAG: 4a-hydroxytetrahydrobiopterin dehydratase [Polyangiaceae bacterium]|nr:4a-hydroxytetrahydrobiopterin dehydratase [Polyangiaceae bacterium]NUQ77922.1 4a-hydroxytetrahydrobiopterin dehydratase [Polyangiaceae bacterium]